MSLNPVDRSAGHDGRSWRPAQNWWPFGPNVTSGLGVAAVGLVAIVLTFFISEYQALDWSSWLLYGLVALSLTWVWGQAGIFSFGQAAFFGIGGYVYGIAAINLLPMTGETFTAVGIAVTIAGVAAALLGYFMFYGKVGDVYVAIITLATSLVLLTFMSSTASPIYHIGSAQLGGYNGMVGIPPLTYGLPGGSGTALQARPFFVVVAIGAAIIMSALSFLRRAPFGRVVAAIRENEFRTQLLGYDVRRYRLVVFAIGGAVAGFAGAVYAASALFISPVVFGLQQAALVVIWVLVGGRGSYLGAFIGAILVQALSLGLGGEAGGLTPIILGSVLIGVVLVLPAGLVPTIQRWSTRAWPKLRQRHDILPPAANTPEKLTVAAGGDFVLRATDLEKSFGRVKAVNGVSISFEKRGVYVLIGPNGAGKSTFFNLLVGRHRPTSGGVYFGEADLTRTEPYARARKGLGIKLQVASLYKELSTFENMWLAAHTRAETTAVATQRAVDMLAWLRLLKRAHAPAGILSHGEQQWLEIGMVLVTEPAVILLDEPTAGMTHEETARTADLVRTLGAHRTVIVVEHDMEFVRELDVPIVVFHQGRIFARGRLDDLQQNEEVLDIYLGRGAGRDAET